MNSPNSITPPNLSNNDDSGDAGVDLDKLVEYQRLKLATAQASQGKRAGNTASADTSLATPAFRLFNDSDLQGLPEQRWIVKNIIPDAGIGTVFGDSGTFKSFIALDLLAHVARGAQWFGKRVKRAPCVYVPLEGRGGIPKRVAAWCQAQMAMQTQFSIDPETLKFTFVAPERVTTNIAFIMEPLNLRNDADRGKLVSTLVNAGLAGGIILIDTLAQAGGGLDENSSEGMGELIRIMQDLQRALSGVTLAVHHSGKDASKGMRGHSSLRAALDFSIECERLPDALSAQFKLDKVKDEMSGTAYPFNMRRVALEWDEDNDMVTSLVVEHEPAVEPVLPTVEPAVENAKVDEFVLDWIRREVENGQFPSARSLTGQLNEMQQKCKGLKRDDIRHAIARLTKDSRLVNDKFGAKGNQKSLQPVDMPTLLDEPTKE